MYDKSHTFEFEFLIFYILFLLGGTKAVKENLLVEETMVYLIFSNYKNNLVLSFTCEHYVLGSCLKEA